MISPSIARKYARALVDAASRRSSLARVVDEVRAVGEVARAQGGEQLRQVIESPAYPERVKRSLIDAVLAKAFPEGVDPVTRNFFEALSLHLRLSDYFGILDVLEAAVDEKDGIIRARLMTATPLSADKIGVIEGAVAAATARRVRLETAVDPTLLGGAVTQIGSTIFDGSVKTQLRRMQELLAGGRQL
jgi:F-type H+-transporting ATPase subunit delta